ncbi:MAG: aminopeptidase [bacterium]|nr:aminopeptidase [bacterium]
MPHKGYHPPNIILERYADVLVNFALGSGKGIKRGDVVYVQASEYAKRLYGEILRAVWKRGGHVIGRYLPDNESWFNFDSEFFKHADAHQIAHFPAKFSRGLIDEIDHSVYIDSETDKQSLRGVDPKKIMERGKAHKPALEWRDKKENLGQFTWTMALYGTPAMAKEAKLREKEYWHEIINACFLDKKDPVAEWKRVYRSLEGYRRRLSELPIERMRIRGPDADLTITLGEKRRWMGGSGRNIPSFELFTSPDWRGTEGWIRFNQPLYHYGNLIQGVELEFRKGRVYRFSARKGEKVLEAMLAVPNGDKVGEFSLTDNRFSRITKFMAETLYDENIGGPNGNTHIALGKAYHDCLKGNIKKMRRSDWQRLGFNDSSVHTDIISTAPRKVTAFLRGGTSVEIYSNGRYTF